MSDDNNLADKMQDFNIDEFMSDDTPSSTPPPLVLADTSKPSKGEGEGKGKYITKDGDTVITFKGGATSTLLLCIDEMKVDESRSCHCLGEDHADINASASIKKIGPNCVSIICFSCNKKFLHKKGNQKKSGSKKDNDSKVSAYDRIIEICSSDLLFHDESGDAYTEVEIQGVKHTIRIGSKEHEEYISYRYYQGYKSGVSPYAITEAIMTLSAMAKYDGDEKKVYIRVANTDDRVFIDTCDDKRRVIEVSSEGLKYSSPPHVKGVKKAKMASLPNIAKHGDITLLKKYLNLKDSDFHLIYGWLFSTLAGIKPFPILIIQGEQGSGKSTITKFLRALIDPSDVPLRSAPKSVQDLMVSAANTYIVVIDNSSGMRTGVSDCICILSTGGGIDERMLQTNAEQYLVEVQRPVIVNGISDLASRPDLADRAITIEPLVMKPGYRRSEKELWSDFEKDKAVIFKGILLGLVSGFKHQDSINLTEKPRIVDAIQFGTACERDLGMEGNFYKAYKENQMCSKQDGIEAYPIGEAIIMLMATQQEYTGTTTELLNKLTDTIGIKQSNSRSWPQSAKQLNSDIKRLTPSFRSLGITISKGKNNRREYLIINTNFKPDTQKSTGSIFGNSTESTPSDDNADSSTDLPNWIKK